MAPSRIHDPAAGLPPPELPSKAKPTTPNGHLMHRSLAFTPHMVESASGINLHLSTGQVVMDACGGAAVAIIGHGNVEVARAMADQALRVGYVHTQAYTTAPAEALADHILAESPFGLTHAFFVGSGSEAVEAALKLARQYAYERGEKERLHFVSRRQGYHGNTMASMSISAVAARKVPYDGFSYPHVSHVSPAFAYRHQQAGETEEEYSTRLVDELEAEFLRIGPETVAAFVAETVVGAATGCVAAPKGYFRGVRALCDRYGILLVLDEVMCGVGRTGTFFAFEQEGIVPDIVTVAKGLGGGYAAIGGVLVHEKVVEALRQGSGAFCHGHTYQAHPVSCAAALAVQQIVKREGLMERCAKMGVVLERMLYETLGERSSVGDIRGRGLFWAVEFVRDRKTKEPFAPELGFGARVQQVAFREGVAVYPGAATADGVKGDHVLVAPPFNVTEEQLERICSVLSAAVEEVEAEVSKEVA
ncbi:acetylornithine aminotransferase [Plectosphaerella cucumerina]|uniref:Acetylornithine aminotransferase n=1 Tax=Plectosphaerella cucumerina TaxID=40658 RepID=A0A8K0TFU6_9PEZI|nr:acetylornithine aminotransferase [Plectosphaerella cucumerina]